MALDGDPMRNENRELMVQIFVSLRVEDERRPDSCKQIYLTVTEATYLMCRSPGSYQALQNMK